MTDLSYRAGALVVAVAAILWSLQGLVIRLIESADSWQVLFWRSVGVLPPLLALIAWRSRGRPFAAIRATGMAGLVGGASLVLAFGGAVYSIQATTVANATFLFSAAPFLTALLAWPVLKEPVRPRTWGAIALAILGVALMVRQGFALGAGAGSLAALVSAAGFAVFTLALRWGRIGDMLPAVAIGAALAALAAAAATLAGGRSLVPDVPADIAVTICLAAPLLFAGMALYTAGSRGLPAAELTLIALLETMLAPVWVFLALDERPGEGTLLGGALILAAVIGNAAAGGRRASRPI